jgi:type VI secretion system protein ImpM
MPEAALNTHAAPGWFGKLPNLGDFASRRLPHRFIRGWDDWLQRGLVSAREELGDQWLALYLVAPIRRFWLAPRVLGRTAWAGLLMPSVDAVGRHFPLTIATPIGAASKSLADVLVARDWFHAIDAVAMQVLDLDFTVEDLERSLAAVSAEAFSTQANAVTDLSAQRLADELVSPFCGAAPEQSARSPGDDSTAREFKRPGGLPVPCSVWWCDEAEQASQFMCFAALPPAASFAALLTRGVAADGD